MTMRHLQRMLGLVLVLALLLSSACRVGFYPIDEELVPCWPNCDGNNNGDNFPMPWGEYAATLDVPYCPPSDYPPLVVNTTDDELDGGYTIADPSQAGEHLSFVEAVWIASNREGQDTILFDPDVFPVDEPDTILIAGENNFPMNSPRVCIDGRNRGVIVDWAEETMGSPVIFHLTDESLMVGLTLLRLPFELVFGSQVAGCRLATDGYETFSCGRSWTVEPGQGSILGPGNVISGNPFAVRVDAGHSGSSIEGNYIGYDPLTRTNLDLRAAFDLRVAAIIENNVIAVTDRVFQTVFGPGVLSGTTSIKGNHFGVDRTGELLPPPAMGVTYMGVTYLDKGEFVVQGNTIHGVDIAVDVAGASGVRITRNSITGCDRGIVFRGAPLVDPPAITSASPGRVAGTCPVAGTVEIFSDPGDQGEVFLGDVPCEADAPWSLDAPVPSGRNVTATLTAAWPGGSRTSAFSAPHPVH